MGKNPIQNTAGANVLMPNMATADLLNGTGNSNINIGIQTPATTPTTPVTTPVATPTSNTDTTRINPSTVKATTPASVIDPKIVAAIKQYQTTYQSTPDMSNPVDKANVYSIAYGHSQLPSNLNDGSFDYATYNKGVASDANRISATGTAGDNAPTNLDVNNLQNNQQMAGDTVNTLEAQRNPFMSALQNVLKIKGNYGNEDVSNSDIGTAAGINGADTGMAGLLGNLKNRYSEIESQGYAMQNALHDMGGMFGSMVDNAKNNFTQATTLYQQAHDRLKESNDNINQLAINSIQNGVVIPESWASVLGNKYQTLRELSINANNLKLKTINAPYNGGINDTTTPNGLSAGQVSIPQDIGTQKNQLAFINNNPGNLRFAGQDGAVQGEGGFAKFSSPEAGYAAMVNDVQTKMTGGSSHLIPDGPNAGQKLGPDSTLEDMIRVYAPTADKNDPVGYAATVARAIGANPTDKLSTLDAKDVASAMANHESGTKIGESATSGSSNNFGLTEDALNEFATTTAFNGMKSSTILPGTKKNNIKLTTEVDNRAAQVLADLGLNATQAQMVSKSSQAAYGKMYTNYTGYKQSEDALMANKAAMDGLLTKLQNQPNFVNKALNVVTPLFDDADRTAYNAGMAILSKDLQPLLSKNGDVTDRVRGESTKLLDPALTTNEFIANWKLLEQDVIANRKSYETNLQGIKNTISTEVGNTPTQTAPASTSGVSNEAVDAYVKGLNIKK